MKKKLSQLTGQARQHRIDQLIGNPATRAAVPSKFLPANLRRQREMNQRLDAPVIPGSSTTGRMLGRDVQSAVAQRYGGQERGLNTELGISDRQQGRIDSYYQVWQDQLKQAAADQAARYGSAVAQVGNLANSLNANSQQQWAGQQAGMAADAATRGATTDPALASTAQNAAIMRQALTGSFGAQLAAQGNADTNYYGQQVGIAGGQRAQEHLNEAARAAKTRSDLTALQGEKGDYANTYRSQRLDAEHRNVLENATFGLNQQKATDSANNTAARIKTTAQTARDKFIAEYGVSPERYRSMSVGERLNLKRKLTAAGKSPPSGKVTLNEGLTPQQEAAMTPAQRLEHHRQWAAAGRAPKTPKTVKPTKESQSSNNAQASILNVQSKFVAKYLREHPGKTRADIVAHMHQAHPDINDVTLAAALDLTNAPGVGRGSISPRVRKLLAAVGVSVTSDGQLA